MLFAGLAVALKEQVDGGSVRKFRSFAETAMADIEQLCHGANLRVHDAKIEFRARAGKGFRFGHGFGKGLRSVHQILALVLVGIDNSKQHAAKTWASADILRGKIGATIERLAIRHEKPR